MRFAIDKDTGLEISGWLAPEAGGPGQLRVVAPGEQSVVTADRVRLDIRDLGLAASEHVGFVIDRTVAPWLSPESDVEIFEAESGAPLYRRRLGPNHLERRVILLDPAVAPQLDLIRTLTDRFAVSCPRVERFTAQTLSSLLSAAPSRSVAFHGRPQLATIASVLGSSGFVRAALLRDPFEELAERLLFLRFLTQAAPPALIAQLAGGAEPLLDLARDLPIEDFKALVGIFRRLTPQQRRAIESPMVRMFGCMSDAASTPEDLSRALDVLASLDVVGVRARFSAFSVLLAHELGDDVLTGQIFQSSAAVLTLAASLAKIGAAVDLLANDTALYADVLDSVDATLAGRQTLIDRAT